MNELLRGLEESEADLSVSLSYLAGTSVRLDPDELRAAVRRAELILATGGDPRRELDPDGRAVTVLADDLDGATQRAQLRAALDELGPAAAGLPRVSAALDELRDDDRAWRLFACARLADALADPA